VDLDLNFHGSVKAGTFTITYNVGAGDATVTATVLATDTPTQAAGKVAAAIDGVTELGASKSGSTVTVTPTNGTSLTKLEASFA
jgi:methenyltetrahydromethanopterin cyclohydrolase